MALVLQSIAWSLPSTRLNFAQMPPAFRGPWQTLGMSFPAPLKLVFNLLPRLMRIPDHLGHEMKQAPSDPSPSANSIFSSTGLKVHHGVSVEKSVSMPDAGPRNSDGSVLEGHVNLGRPDGGDLSAEASISVLKSRCLRGISASFAMLPQSRYLRLFAEVARRDVSRKWAMSSPIS